MRTSHLTVASGALALGLLLGGGTCIPEPDPDPVDTRSNADLFGDALAGFFNRCMAEQNRFINEVEPTFVDMVFDSEGFVEFMVESFRVLEESPHTTVDRALLEACLGQLESASCEDAFASNPFCDDAIMGDLLQGAACAMDAECAGEASCFGRTDTECGSCQLRAGPGESCVGRDCDSDHDCSAEGVCVEEPTDPPDPTFSVGDSCDPEGDECGSWGRSGLACVDQEGDGTGVCTQTTIADEGEPCEMSNNGEWLAVCRYGTLTTHYCNMDIAGGLRSGTCERRPSVGEPCVALFNFCNGLEAYCSADGQCEALTPLGGACDPEASPNTCGLAICDGEERVCRPLVDYDLEVPEPLVCE